MKKFDELMSVGSEIENITAEDAKKKLNKALLNWWKKKDFMNIIVARMANQWVQIIFLGPLPCI